MVIVLDAEAVANNAIKLPRYVPLEPQLADQAGIEAEEAAVGLVVTMERKEYRREWMRKKREAERAAKEEGDV